MDLKCPLRLFCPRGQGKDGFCCVYSVKAYVMALIRSGLSEQFL